MEGEIWELAYKLPPGKLQQLKTYTAQVDRQYGFSPIFTQLLWQRGLYELPAIEAYLQTDKQAVANYYRNLFDVESASKLLLKSLKSKAKVFIYGDYDVDGITSTSLLWRFLYRELKADVVPFVPHRSREGYGLNEKALNELLAHEVKQNKKRQLVLITVDCGSKDNEVIARLRAEYPQLKVIITDHHQLNSNKEARFLPAADVFVHPLLPKSQLQPTEICACAVTWALICSLRQNLGLELSLTGLELVALATVCDIMPLTGINRLLVALGLKELQSTSIVGLEALKQVSGLSDQKLMAYHLGFVLGPRLNAAGRIGEPLDAVRLLSTDNMSAAQRLAYQLDQLNHTRQQLTEIALKQVEEELTIGNSDRLIIVHDGTWAEGVIGLIAGKLQEKFGLPSIAMTQKESGEWVGSARSNKNIDITNLLAQHENLLSRYGGHVQAAGFSLPAANLNKFSTAIRKTAREQISSQQVRRSVSYDLELRPVDVNINLIKELELLEPFGMGNIAPSFFLRQVSSSKYRQFGKTKEHLAYTLSPDSATAKLELVWFNHQLAPNQYQLVHDFIGTLGYNEWNGQLTAQFKVKHHRLWQN